MGIYTNSALTANNHTNSDYTSVEPYSGSHFNFHELGILAATECAANNNAFMKAIALNELAAYEQTGSTDVLYESVNIKNIFNKVKMFFKKIIEKIHKIFHTFVAKMASWFGGNKKFAEKYHKEIVNKWDNVKNDFEFKGYKFSIPYLTKASSASFKADIKTSTDSLKTLLNCDLSNVEVEDTEISTIRENIDGYKDHMRKCVIDKIGEKAAFYNSLDLTGTEGYDQTEYTEQLFKVYRSGQDSKDNIKKDEILNMYGGSVNSMMTFIKDFDQIKKNIESVEKTMVNGIDNLISGIEKAEDKLIKSNTPDTASKNEKIVQVASLVQSLWGAKKEIDIQAFSALLQATKDACSQAKEICVKVIGMNKKMTNESYDNTSGSDYDFISSVKLV